MGLSERVNKIWNDFKLGLAKGLVYTAIGAFGCGGNGGGGNSPVVTGPVTTNQQGEAEVNDTDGNPFRVIVKDEKDLTPLPDKRVYVVHHSEEVYTMDPLKEYISDFRILLSNPINLEVLLSNLNDRISDGLSEYKTSFHSEEINWTLGTEKINKDGPVPLSGLAEFYKTHEDTSKSMALVLEVASNYSVIGQFAKQAWELRQDIIENACPVAQLIGLNPDEIFYDIYLERTSGLLYHKRVFVDFPAINISNTADDSVVPDITVDTINNPHVTWIEVNEANEREIFYSKYNSNSWTLPVNVSNNSGISEGSKIVSTLTDIIHIIWVDNTPGNWEILSSKYNGGWSTPTNISNNSGVSGYPCLAIDSANSVYVAWGDETSGTVKILLSKYNGSWSIPQIISDGSIVVPPESLVIYPLDPNCFNPTITRDTLNNLHAAWDEDGNIFYSKNPWTDIEAVSNSGDFSERSSIVVDSSNIPNIVWHENKSGNWDIFYSTSLGDFKWSTPENVSNNSGISAYPCLAIDSNNDLHMVWIDLTDGNQDIFYSKHTSFWSPPENISQSVKSSAGPRVVVDANNLLHIVWHERHPITDKWEIFYKKLKK